MLFWTRNPQRVLWQTLKTQMKCRMMRHFIRACNVCQDKQDFQRKKLEIETCEPSIYTTDHPVFIVCSSMGNSIGPKMVRNTTASDTCELRHLILIYYVLLIQCIVEPRHEKTYVLRRLGKA